MKYYAKSNIRNGKNTFERGDEIEVSGVDEQQLLEAGVLSTDPIVDAHEEVQTEEKAQPTLGGEAQPQSGEPSLDGAETAASGEAKDVTPGFIGRIFGSGETKVEPESANTSGTSASVGDAQVASTPVSDETGESTTPASDPSANL